ncbi:hypothetical protein [Cohnella panacarvi]|uniref:hypothetical protein n=1 Tax=Cohnella panacarvi TaxID=400776 RepID=UPI000478D839|nr:hypothetical protein [Cohnella panacarvi]
MILLGLNIPSFRKGTSVKIADPACAKGAKAEMMFAVLDPKEKHKKSPYGTPKKGAVGKIVSIMKFKSPEGEVSIYYGVLVKDVLYALAEDKLARA